MIGDLSNEKNFKNDHLPYKRRKKLKKNKQKQNKQKNQFQGRWIKTNNDKRSFWGGLFS